MHCPIGALTTGEWLVVIVLTLMALYGMTRWLYDFSAPDGRLNACPLCGDGDLHYEQVPIDGRQVHSWSCDQCPCRIYEDDEGVTE